MEIYYLTLSHVEQINNKLLSASKTSYNYKGGIEFILSNVKNTYDKLPERDAIIGKASYLWYAIASNQYLSNGNKRTGYTVAELFLQLNKFTINTTQEEKHAISTMIAQKVYQVDHVRQLLTKLLKEVEEKTTHDS